MVFTAVIAPAILNFPALRFLAGSLVCYIPTSCISTRSVQRPPSSGTIDQETPGTSLKRTLQHVLKYRRANSIVSEQLVVACVGSSSETGEALGLFSRMGDLG